MYLLFMYVFMCLYVYVYMRYIPYLACAGTSTSCALWAAGSLAAAYL